jgi:hypothetical protein
LAEALGERGEPIAVVAVARPGGLLDDGDHPLGAGISLGVLLFRRDLDGRRDRLLGVSAEAARQEQREPHHHGRAEAHR